MYNYEVQKSFLFTDEGQRMFLKVRDYVGYLLEEAGAFKMIRAWENVTGGSWDMLACVDRLVELGEILEVKKENTAGQDRIFIKAVR